MIDTSKEKLLPFKEAAQLVPMPVSTDTIRNWALRGAHGVHLDYLKIGARYYTTAEAVKRFLDESRNNNWRGVWNGATYDAVLNRQREQADQNS